MILITKPSIFSGNRQSDMSSTPAQKRRTRFEFRHITIVFVMLILAQLVISFFHKATLKSYLIRYEEANHRTYARQLVNISQNMLATWHLPGKGKAAAPVTSIRDFFFPDSGRYPDIRVMVLIPDSGGICRVIEDSLHLVRLMNQSKETDSSLRRFSLPGWIRDSLQTRSPSTPVFDPGTPGRLAVYAPVSIPGREGCLLMMTMSPGLSPFTREIISSYDESTIIYLSFILLGILAMYYIASYTAVERDEAQEQLVKEHEQLITEQVVHEKESLFTRRIYHTHHKAEKVMGFIKDDLRSIRPENIDEIKARVIKYSNFISRVIYDMKWYDTPVQTIRNPIFQTDMNELIRFIVQHIFQRTSTVNTNYTFELDLDPQFPRLTVNEFVLWEILEPIIQNAIEHSGESKILIRIQTRWTKPDGPGRLVISDNGRGISPDLLAIGEGGVKKLFLENASTKQSVGKNSGYGCFIAWHLATSGCGWHIDATNNPDGGARFTLDIPHA